MIRIKEQNGKVVVEVTLEFNRKHFKDDAESRVGKVKEEESSASLAERRSLKEKALLLSKAADTLAHAGSIADKAIRENVAKAQNVKNETPAERLKGLVNEDPTE